MSELKDILKKLRSENNINQTELAEQVGVASSTVAMWEVGKRFPNREKIEALADIFNVDIDYLYGRTDIRQKVRFDNDGNMMVYSDFVVSSEERALIEVFRKLSPDGKSYLLQTAKLALVSFPRSAEEKRA